METFICAGFAVFAVLGLLVLSVLNVQTCETWNYVEYSSPLVYSKFYSSDSNFIMVWQIKS